MSNYNQLYKKYIVGYGLGNKQNEKYINKSHISFEIRLYIIHEIPLALSAEDGWSIFTKYFHEFCPDNVTIPLAIKGWIYKLRKENHNYSLKSFWNQELAEYKNVPGYIRMFSINENGEISINPSCQRYPDRLDQYRLLLDGIQIETAKSYQVADEAILFNNLIMPLHGESADITSLTGYKKKKLYTIDRNTDWNTILMSMGEGYAERPPIQLNFGTKETLELKGLKHIVGSLGAGKSTFKMALIYNGVKNKGIRFGLVESSISHVIDLTFKLRKLGIKAVPYIGNISEAKYLEYYMENCLSMDEIIESKEVKLLSGSCIVNAYLELNDEKYPCNQLTDEEGHPSICPFIGKCGHMKRYREFSDAEVIIATPQAIVKSSLIFPLDLYQRSLYEIYYDLVDVIIVDEADGVQRTFEEELMIDENIIGGKEGLLNQILQLAQEDRMDTSDNIMYRFKEDTKQLEQMIDLMERVLLHNAEILTDIYSYKSLVPTLLRDELLDGLEYGLVEIDGHETSFEQELSKYVELSDSFRIKEEHLSHEFKEMINLVQFIHWTPDIQPEEEIEKKVKELFDKYGVKVIASKNREFTEKIQKQRFILLMLLVQFDSMFKRLCASYANVYMRLNNEYKSLSGYGKLSRRLQHLVKEPCLGTLYGYRLTLKDGHKLNIDVLRYDGVGRDMLIGWSDIKSELGLEGPSILCLSGTSLAPGSAHYNIEKRPDGLLKGKEEGQIHMVFQPQVQDTRFIRISGSTGYNRLYNLTVLTEKLINEIRYCLNTPKHRKILLITGSYEEARRVSETLRENEIRSYYVGNDDYNSEYSIHRNNLEAFPEETDYADVCVAPLNIIARGYNILDEKGDSYFGTMFIMVRPYMVPGDYDNYIQMLHYELPYLIQKINSEENNYNRRLNLFRKRCFIRFNEIVNISTWKSLSSDQREVMTWFIMILLKQAVGRMQRNGNECFVTFCDAAFCDEIQVDEEDKTFAPVNSVLHSIEKLLKDTITEEYMEPLYANFLNAIAEMNRNIERTYSLEEDYE